MAEAKMLYGIEIENDHAWSREMSNYALAERRGFVVDDTDTCACTSSHIVVSVPRKKRLETTYGSLVVTPRDLRVPKRAHDRLVRFAKEIGIKRPRPAWYVLVGD
jgi:hypothetical protein